MHMSNGPAERACSIYSCLPQSDLPRFDGVCSACNTAAAPEHDMIHNWMRMLLAVLLGNLIYFTIEPLLPAPLGHSLYEVDAGLLLDFTICVGIYLLLRRRPDK